MKLSWRLDYYMERCRRCILEDFRRGVLKTTITAAITNISTIAAATTITSTTITAATMTTATAKQQEQ